jgi:hypothetical protein
MLPEKFTLTSVLVLDVSLEFGEVALSLGALRLGTISVLGKLGGLPLDRMQLLTGIADRLESEGG